jgi:hypothetical protein
MKSKKKSNNYEASIDAEWWDWMELSMSTLHLEQQQSCCCFFCNDKKNACAERVQSEPRLMKCQIGKEKKKTKEIQIDHCSYRLK